MNTENSGTSTSKSNVKHATISIDDPVTGVFFMQLVDQGMAKLVEDKAIGKNEMHAALHKEGKKHQLIVKVHSLGIIPKG